MLLPVELWYLTCFMSVTFSGPDMYTAILTQILFGVPTRKYPIAHDLVIDWDDVECTGHRNLFMLEVFGVTVVSAKLDLSHTCSRTTYPLSQTRHVANTLPRFLS